MSPTPINGTDAKDIAFHFLSMTGVERATPQIIARTIAQAKRIMGRGYIKEDIMSAIDKAVSKGIHMYSIGYISTSIDDLLKEIETDRIREKGHQIKLEMEKQVGARKAVTSDGESAERNRTKAERFGIQSRLGEKFNFDMFEKQ